MQMMSVHRACPCLDSHTRDAGTCSDTRPNSSTCLPAAVHKSELPVLHQVPTVQALNGTWNTLETSSQMEMASQRDAGTSLEAGMVLRAPLPEGWARLVPDQEF